MAGKGKKMANGKDPKGNGAKVGPAQPQGELIDMEQAIERLKTTRPTFYRWLRSGKIKGMKVGRQWRFYPAEIERFLKGEEPKIELSADLGPLLATLRKRAGEVGVPQKDIPSDKDVPAAVSLMIQIAYHMRASDIHLFPHMRAGGEGPIAALSFRVDGVLNNVAEFDVRLIGPIAERWKTLANCNVQEKRQPQDGRILAALHKPDGKKPLDLRVSFLPACLGEAVTARILGPSVVQLSIERVTFSPESRERLLKALGAPSGIVVVCGPTGSGKTTTLYACANRLACPDRKVVSVEHPVEFFLPWVVQVQVAPQVGLTMAAALRSALRSAPNVIMTTDLRDSETLQLLLQAALGGHLVLTSFHADDAASGLKRMVDLGGEPIPVGDTTRLIIAQRLVRNLCPECSVEEAPPDGVLDQIKPLVRSGGLSWEALPKTFRKAVGCAKCHQMGFRGRSSISEALEVTPEIASALRRGASAEELRTLAVGQGMVTMAADAVRAAATGRTTLREAMGFLGLGAF